LLALPPPDVRHGGSAMVGLGTSGDLGYNTYSAAWQQLPTPPEQLGPPQGDADRAGDNQTNSRKRL